MDTLYMVRDKSAQDLGVIFGSWSEKDRDEVLAMLQAKEKKAGTPSVWSSYVADEVVVGDRTAVDSLAQFRHKAPVT